MDSGAPRSAGFYDFLGWLETNKKRVAIGVGAVLVIAFVAGFWVWRNSERALEAEEALSAVRMPFNPAEPAAPGTADALAKIAVEYPGTPAAAKALLRAGAVYFSDGNFARARQQYDRYLREFGATPWVPEAVFGVAACLEAENKIPEAINKYKDFIASHGTDLAADLAKFKLARLYEESNQPQLALEILSKMMGSQQPGMPQQQPSPSAAEAQSKLRALLAKHPSLMPANPAPQARPPVTLPPVVVPPQANPGTPGTPPIIVNPAQPTPGQPNPIPVNPAPANPAPVTPAPVNPVPVNPVPVNPVPVNPAPATPAPAK